MEQLASWLSDIVPAIVDLFWHIFANAPLIAIPVIAVLLLLAWRDSKILLDVFLLLLIGGIIMSVSQFGMDAVDAIELTLSSNTVLK